MVVNVRLFAILRERAGSGSVTVELADGATVRDAVDAVGREHGLDELIARMPVVMAVNREYAPAESALSEGDELALIPPVSGGEGGARVEANQQDAPSGGDGAYLAEFRDAEGYESFMELVGNHVPRLPAYAELLGIRPLRAEPGHVKLEFRVTEQLLNPAGTIQGGFLTAMLDEAMGPAALSDLGPGYMIPTLELKVNFISPGLPGRFVADARVVHRGRSVAFLESRLEDGDGKLIATATATARIVPLKKAE